MAYESFARKYRPKNFGEVVGQENPCGECENCREIEKGSFPDMYEIDAASNRGIDDIRSLRDNVSYAPIKGRYKVYIIDDNIFILATTELHKIPDTIRSRCQTFIFRPPSKTQIKDYLKRILEKEGIKYDEEALDLISGASEGGVRDAASILDQAVIYGSGEVKIDTTQELLGVIPEEILKEFLKNLKEKNLKELIKTVERLIFEKQDLELLIYTSDIFKKASLEARSFNDKKDVYQLAILKIRFMKNLIPLKEILEKGIPSSEPIKKEEKKEEGFDLQKAILKIGKEAGGIISGALKNASIRENEDSFTIMVDRTVSDLLNDRLR